MAIIYIKFITLLTLKKITYYVNINEYCKLFGNE